MDDGMGGQSRRRRLLVGAAGLAVSGLAIALVVATVDVAAAGRVLAKAAPGPLILALAVALVALGVRFVLWQLLLPTRQDGARIPLARIAPVSLVGYLGNTILPARLGELLRPYLISRREPITFSGALASVALERILDIATIAGVAFAAAISVGAASWIIQGTAILAAGTGCMILLLGTIGLGPALRPLRWLGQRPTFRRPVELAIARLDQFAYWSGGAHRRRAILVAFVLSLVAWLGNAAVFWLVAEAVGAPVPVAGAALIMGVTVLSTAIPSAPAYVGTFELAAVAIATSLGVSADAALAAAILAHVITLLPVLVGGPMALAALGGGLRSLSFAALSERRATRTHVA